MNSRTRTGFSLVELLIVIALIALLSAILFPVFAQSREKARQSVCLSNLRQLTGALALYTADYDSAYLGNNTAWDTQLLPYLRNRRVFACPSLVTPYNNPMSAIARGYAYNYALTGEIDGTRRAVRETEVRWPSATVAFAEISLRADGTGGVAYSTAISGPEQAPDTRYYGGPGGRRHHGGAHYAFVDGHVRWLRPEAVGGAWEDISGERPAFRR